MKKAIIHISDLHIMLHTSEAGKSIDKKNINSWLNTDPSDENVQLYIEKFIEYINERYKDYELYLIISGDITDKALDEEFELANKIIESILKKIKISEDKLLLIPGDHDVNWNDCKNAYNSQSIKRQREAFDFQQEKFKKYKNYISSTFEEEKAIINNLIFEEEKIIIYGINSNYKIDFEGGLGFISIDKLKQDLLTFPKYDEFSKIAVFHHNITANFQNNINGQWDVTNRLEVLKILQNNNFSAVLFGNEHTSGSKYDEELYCVAVGSFSMKDPLPSFKIYEISNNENELKLIQSRIQNVRDNDNHSHRFGNWSKIEVNNLPEIEELILREKPLTQDVEVTILVAEPVEEEEEEEEEFNAIKTIDYLTNPFHKKLFSIVKQNNIYQSGHFHWSESSRAHNWIDIPKLLSNKENVLLAKKAIFNILTSYDLADKFDAIIGLGIEGNILATRTALISGKPYSFLPYSYRYNGHADYEKDLVFKNNGEFKNVLIITDVVHDGKTIRNLIHKREKDFFLTEKVKKIYVISLFYTGDKAQNIGIMNLTQREINTKKIEGDFIEDRIEFYFVSKMKVETCPYGSDYRDSCMIFKEKLDCVHEFYDADLALDKKTKM